MLDPITLELVQEGLISVVREMRANLIRSAYSAIIYEGHDFSCALISPGGELVALSPDDHPLHIFPVSWSTRQVLATFPGEIRPGDIYLHNDPYTGGTHLNDVAMVFPIFEGEALVLFAVARVHWGDVGGMTPGSLSGRATEIFQEGLRLPPVRIYREGVPNADLLKVLFSNMRVPEEREGDFRATVGACRIAEARVQAMARRLGARTLAAAVDRLLERAEARMRRLIGGVPDGEYCYETYFESDGTRAQPLPVRVRLQVQGESVTADFAGTAPQTDGGPVNGGPALAPAAVFTLLKALLDPEGPINGGAFRPIAVQLPEGSLVNARPPAAMGGMVEVKSCCDSLVMGALGHVLPEGITGDLKGGGNHVYISGPVPGQPGRSYIFYEWPAGGTGGWRGADGNNGARNFTEGDFSSIQPIEAIENQFPLRVERLHLRPDSGGPGRRRGGLGLERHVRVLAPGALLSVLSEKNVIPPYGVHSGGPGAPNRFTVLRGGQEVEPSAIPGKVSGFRLEPGDVVRICTAGGGGYGDPLAREPGEVLADLREGYVTPGQAREQYGIALVGAGPAQHATGPAQDAAGPAQLAVDEAATAALRAELRQGRRQATVAVGVLPSHPHPRAVALSPEQAAAWGLRPGALVECAAVAGAPLRAWVVTDPAVAAGQVRLDAAGAAVLGATAGTTVLLRALR